MSAPYSLSILWHERARYFPAVLAIAFSAVLIALQSGLLVAMLLVASRPISRAGAEIWVGSRDVPSLGYGQPIPSGWKARLLSQPEVESVEEYLFGFVQFHKPDGGMAQCYLVGCRLGSAALGAPHEVTPQMRAALAQPGAMVVAASEVGALGLASTPGGRGEVANHHVRVVGLVQDFRGEGLMPGLYGSVGTARPLLPMVAPEQTSYLLVRCRAPGQAEALAARLRAQYPDMEALTSDAFSRRTWGFWLTRTKAGPVLGLSAGLGLLVGAVITSQTLRAAILAARRELAVLRALGVPRRRLVRLVLAQSVQVTTAGLVVALPVVQVLARVANAVGVAINLPAWLLGGTAALTLAVALFSGLTAARSLQEVEPALLLR